MAKKRVEQKGVSSYVKNKKRTLKELDQATDYRENNTIDDQAKQMDYEDEERKGITDYIRHIFEK